MLQQDTINKAISEARRFCEWDECIAAINAIRDNFPKYRNDPQTVSVLAYALGVSIGKYQERQRSRGKSADVASLAEDFKTGEVPALKKYATGDGDFLYTVEGDGAAPAFVAGDVVTIRAAACTPDLQTARAVVIRQGDRALIGRLVMYRDGSADLIHGGQLVPFDPERDFIGPVVAVWRALEPAAPATE